MVLLETEKIKIIVIDFIAALIILVFWYALYNYFSVSLLVALLNRVSINLQKSISLWVLKPSQLLQSRNLI